MHSLHKSFLDRPEGKAYASELLSEINLWQLLVNMQTENGIFDLARSKYRPLMNAYS
jgi:hypothetical protein